jgi:GDP/UDP-N,N'-diacetylbacillosamine 2-epimerase (hydrolysing)
MTKISVITSTRADFGLLKNLILALKKSNFDSSVIASGTHFSKKYGTTANEIKQSKIKIDAKIIQKIGATNSVGVSKLMSNFISGTAKVLAKLKPDLVILLGDRYEILGSAIAAHLSRIPIAHIHGGELTNGVIDDAFRHAITKMSQIHFVSNEIYRRRVIQLGENPKSVFTVGGMGVDSIINTDILSKKKMEKKLKIKFQKKSLLINLHPETLNQGFAKYQITAVLDALKELTDTTFIFTMPGAEIENNFIINEIEKFVKINVNAFYFKSLGQINYFSILKIVDAMIGNSSSGLLEMPTFKKATINLGNRHEGRLKSLSVLDVKIKSKEISKAIKTIYTKSFQKKIKSCKNPYGVGGASLKILQILKKKKFKDILIKKFYDL